MSHDGISINPAADRPSALQAALADLLSIDPQATPSQIIEAVQTVLRERRDFERLAQMREVRVGELETLLSRGPVSLVQE